MRRREILTPAQDVRTFDSFASALFSPVPDRSTTGRTPGRSDQWPNADPEAGRDAFRDFALRLSGIGRRYYELQMDRQLAVVDEVSLGLLCVTCWSGSDARAIARSAVGWSLLQRRTERRRGRMPSTRSTKSGKRCARVH